MISEKERVLARIQNLCVRKEYCCSEIRKKLLSLLDGNEIISEELLMELVADRFVDDLRYATAFARDKSSIDGWGPVKISCQLRGKGIAPQYIKEALDSIDVEKSELKMKSVIVAKRRSLKGDPQLKIKLLKYALSRGYDYDAVKDAVDEVISDGQS